MSTRFTWKHHVFDPLLLNRLTVGSALGSIRELFAKVSAIDKKHGKFDLLLCVGDFFGPPTEDSGTSDDDASQLLDGLLEGMGLILHHPITNMLILSPYRMLYHAGRISLTSTCN